MADPARLSIHQATLLRQCTTPQFIEAMARNGVPCASLWRDKVREHGVERTASLVAGSGIAMSGYCFGGIVTSPDAREAARARDDVRRALDEAAALGAPCLVFVAGGVDASEKSIAGARARALDAVAELIPHARSVGVRLAIEPLHPMICATRSVLSTVGQATRWCDMLAADDVVGIAVDTYAVWWDPDLEAKIARAGRRICAFHVSDWLADTQDLRLDRGMMGDGVIDLPGIRAMVERAGFDGWVEVEIFSQRNWWKRDPDDVVAVIRERIASAT
ncbi:MAG TPA: sugar phosphate isomerase/epimerase family protein [Casimicrobiaceae bacterium]|nr:sugar phosphate isomerase/epimerase family protein [Casimicrobiaceae bacterium]